MSDSTTHIQATVHQTVGADESKALGPEPVDKQRIVPGGLPILPQVAPEAASSSLSHYRPATEAYGMAIVNA